MKSIVDQARKTAKISNLVVFHCKSTLEAQAHTHTYIYIVPIIYFVNNATTSAAERESEASLFRFRLSRTNSILQ